MNKISEVGKAVTEMITEIDEEEKKLNVKTREIAKEFNYPVCIILVSDPKNQKHLSSRWGNNRKEASFAEYTKQSLLKIAFRIAYKLWKRKNQNE
ncbi:MAG: hypothetical protein GY714_12385 [Desulfobacterales bacterium]|nr:hypothetical protein [Desulfobacterales bacterium]